MTSLATRRSPQFCRIVKEKLNGSKIDFTSFFFHYGGNIYALGYKKDGAKRYTLIDSGDARYEERILPILAENGIDASNVERIIITHRHFDHCGLVRTLGKNAKITAHSNFRDFVEGQISPEERQMLRGFDPSEIKSSCDLDYLPPVTDCQKVDIGGMDFPILADSISLGKAGKIAILSAPDFTPTHSPDQVIIFYSPTGKLPTYNGENGKFLPTDDIVFSGDLWLMRGPIRDWGDRTLIQRFRNRRRRLGWNPQEQDSKTKEALKRGFYLVRVEPGHGSEFIGSRIIPNGILADRDILLELGYPQNADKDILTQPDIVPKVFAVKEKAYLNFAKEVHFWLERGYTLKEISSLLIRIYSEQKGGGIAVRIDRRQRKERLKATLTRLMGDKKQSEELQQVAAMTLPKLK